MRKKEIEAELSMSDFDFKRNYIEKNKQWWDEYQERHKGMVHCADCGTRIESPEDIRPYGGKNYDSECFRRIARREVTSVRGFHTPDACIASEWLLRVSRVMDGVALIGE